MRELLRQLRSWAGRGKRAVLRRWYRRGGRGRERLCPVCGSHLRRFQAVRPRPGVEALCPVCLTQDRHRLAMLYFTRRTDLFDGRPKRLLHVAPEPEFTRVLRGVPDLEYLSVDVCGPTMLRTDLTNLPLPDDRFDVVYCAQVLEHIADDRRALAELYRVLKPGGWMLLQVPVTGDTTREDPQLTDPALRERLFGHHDHFRACGRDYADRIREAGFVVTLEPYGQELPVEEVVSLGLSNVPEIFFCRKPQCPEAKP